MTPFQRPVILLTGRSGSGKSTVAEILARRFGFFEIAIASPMKHLLRNLGVSGGALYGSASAREAPSDALGGRTAREALQSLGTDWGRAFYEDIWIQAAMRQAHYMTDSNNATRGIVISDGRFPNELKWARDAGAYLWRVKPWREIDDTSAMRRHMSETSLDGWSDDNFDTVIPGPRGSLEELESYVVAEASINLKIDPTY